jgi:putative SOS response-associated peptidase YedK
MCGRVIQSSPRTRLAIVEGLDVSGSRVHNYRRTGMAHPAKSYWSFGGEVSVDPLRWGLIPHFCEDPKGGRKLINAKCETVRTLPTFRDAYRRRRCILPVDGFFEWKATKGARASATLNCSPVGFSESRGERRAAAQCLQMEPLTNFFQRLPPVLERLLAPQ